MRVDHHSEISSEVAQIHIATPDAASLSGQTSRALRKNRRSCSQDTIEANEREIREVYLEYRARVGEPKGPVGAAYGRYSTDFQSSVADQIRAVLSEAERRSIFIPEEHIYRDYGISGMRRRRPGLKLLLEAVASRKVQVVIALSSSRLYRNHRACMEFIEDEIVGNNLRCLIVDKNIDTASQNDWQQIIMFNSMMDQYQATAHRANIRAAHIGKANRGEIWGSLPVGYMRDANSPESSQTCVEPVGAETVRRCFRWFVEDKFGIEAIVRKLNADPNCPVPALSNGRWSHTIVRRLLQNPRYQGNWAYGRTERKWLNKADYARAYPRPEPLLEKHHEHLRIIDDATFHAAQARLAEFKGDRGRKNSKGKRDPVTFLIGDLFWCRDHHRRLYRSGPRNRVYFTCQHCRQTDVSDRSIFSYLDGRTAVRCLLAKLRDLLLSDEGFVDRVLSAVVEADAVQHLPDEAKCRQLETEIAKLNSKITFTIKNLGDSADDKKQCEELLREFRSERSSKMSDLARIQELKGSQILVPTRQEVVERVASLVESMEDAIESSSADEETLTLAREILRRFTNGRVWISQLGVRAQHRGALRGEFEANLISWLSDEAAGASGRIQGALEKTTVDFIRPNEDEVLAKAIIEARRAGFTYDQIAQTHNVGRNRASKLVRRFAPKIAPELAVEPGKRSKRCQCERPPYQQISDEVQRRFEERETLGQIAETLGVDRNTVTKALEFYYCSRGEPMPNTRKKRR